MTVTRTCDLKPPVVHIAPEEWPDPDAEGITHLVPKVTAKVFATLKSFVNFVEVYRAGCTETGD